jgi:hypothetical protein
MLLQKFRNFLIETIPKNISEEIEGGGPIKVPQAPTAAPLCTACTALKTQYLFTKQVLLRRSCPSTETSMFLKISITAPPSHLE